MYDVDSIMRKFARFLRKNPNSNLQKFMTVFSEQLQDLKETNQRIQEWRTIDDAEGLGLDMIGEIVRQPRGATTDEIYRILLKAKNAQALSDGTVNTILHILSLALDTDPSEFRLVEKWHDPAEPEEMTVNLVDLPIKRLNEAGMTPNQLGELLKVILSLGVKLELIELTGTFSFGGLPMETDPATGFGNIEGTTGGYLGTVFLPSNDRPLPI